MEKLSHWPLAMTASEGGSELDHDTDYDSKSPNLVTLLLS